MPPKSLYYSPQKATSDKDIEDCFALMVELRPNLQRKTFLHAIRHMEEEGYSLVFIQNNDNIVSIAGYRITNNLCMGKNLYVDDLITDNQHRSKGYGERLITWLRSEAIKANCNIFHLDSGTHRGLAHKFYFQRGLSIASYHFSESLKTP